MYLKSITTRLLHYNLWANKRIVSWLAAIDQQILYIQTDSSFGTIDRTIQHILSAQIYWYEIIVNGQINEFDQPVRENAVEQVMDDLIINSQRLADDFSIFTNEQLIEIIPASDSTQSRYEYILHLFNHGSYHRGQIVMLGRALKITGEIPVTDYDAYLWWIENM